MAGLAYNNSCFGGGRIVLAIVVIRGIARKETDKLGNFWVDTTRCLLWVLLPICVAGSLCLCLRVSSRTETYTTVQWLSPDRAGDRSRWQGHYSNCDAAGHCKGLASQEVIKEFGTNGGW